MPLAIARDHRRRPVHHALEPRRIARELEHGARAADVDPARGVVVDAHEVDAGEVVDPRQLLRQRAVLGARQPEVHVADVADQHLGAIAGVERLRAAASASARELVAREHVELGLGLGGEQLRDHPRRGERRKPGDERDLAPPASVRGAVAVARAGARIGPCFASISATTRSTCAGERVEIAVVVDHPRRGRELVGERRLRGDPRARVVEREPVACDEPRLLDLGRRRHHDQPGEPGVRAILDEQRRLVEHDAARRHRRHAAIARALAAAIRGCVIRPRSARAAGSRERDRAEPLAIELAIGRRGSRRRTARRARRAPAGRARRPGARADRHRSRPRRARRAAARPCSFPTRSRRSTRSRAPSRRFRYHGRRDAGVAFARGECVSVGLALVVSSPPRRSRASQRDWTGSAACGTCHPAELAAWQATPHAHDARAVRGAAPGRAASRVTAPARRRPGRRSRSRSAARRVTAPAPRTPRTTSCAIDRSRSRSASSTSSTPEAARRGCARAVTRAHDARHAVRSDGARAPDAAPDEGLRALRHLGRQADGVPAADGCPSSPSSGARTSASRASSTRSSGRTGSRGRRARRVARGSSTGSRSTSKFHLVDLPGLRLRRGQPGDARELAPADRDRTSASATTLAGVLLLIDIRRGVRGRGARLRAVARRARAMPVVVALTKSDKLPKNKRMLEVMQAEEGARAAPRSVRGLGADRRRHRPAVARASARRLSRRSLLPQSSRRDADRSSRGDRRRISTRSTRSSGHSFPLPWPRETFEAELRARVGADRRRPRWRRGRRVLQLLDRRRRAPHARDRDAPGSRGARARAASCSRTCSTRAGAPAARSRRSRSGARTAPRSRSTSAPGFATSTSARATTRTTARTRS